MLMLAILTWEKDLVIQPARSMQWIRDLKRRLDNPDAEFIVFDSNFLNPFRLDHATRQLAEDEVIEWLHMEVYPALLEEGQMYMKNGTYKYVRNNAKLIK